MIIPVRCFTCNKVIGDKWEKYQELIKHSYTQTDDSESNEEPKCSCAIFNACFSRGFNCAIYCAFCSSEYGIFY